MTDRTRPSVTADSPIGPDVDLDEDDVRLADGTGLTGQRAEEVVEAGGFAAGVPLIEYISLDAVARGVDDPEESGGAFAFAGVLIADGGFVGLEAVLLDQSGMDEFVNWLA